MPPTVLIASTCPPPTACAGEPRHTPAGAACRRPEQAGAGAGGPMQPVVVADVAVGERAQGSSSSNVPATCGGRPCPPSACPACPGLAAAARANPGAFSRFTTGELGGGSPRFGAAGPQHAQHNAAQLAAQRSRRSAARLIQGSRVAPKAAGSAAEAGRGCGLGPRTHTTARPLINQPALSTINQSASQRINRSPCHPFPYAASTVTRETASSSTAPCWTKAASR